LKVDINVMFETCGSFYDPQFYAKKYKSWYWSIVLMNYIKTFYFFDKYIKTFVCFNLWRDLSAQE